MTDHDTHALGPAKPRGEVKVAGFFDESYGELNGMHGVFIACCPDEAAAIAAMLYRVVDLVPVDDDSPRIREEKP